MSSSWKSHFLIQGEIKSFRLVIFFIQGEIKSFPLVILFIQGEFTMEEIQVYKEVFGIIDADGSGCISTSELKKYVYVYNLGKKYCDT